MIRNRKYQVGATYETIGGDRILIIDEQYGRGHVGYECVRGHDGRWRYDRDGDYGRCTGSEQDNPHNLVVPDTSFETWELLIKDVVAFAQDGTGLRKRLNEQADILFNTRLVLKYQAQGKSLDEIVQEIAVGVMGYKNYVEDPWSFKL